MKRTIIFEGPDGAGKTTLINAVATRLNCPSTNFVVHCGAYPRVTDGLADIYAAAMMPALLEQRHVLMDRSWIAEPIYGAVARGGRNRISDSDRERLIGYARSCGATIVFCLPPYEKCRDAYLSRKGIEYLADESKLRDVYDLYASASVHCDLGLPMKVYDWTRAPYDVVGEVLEFASVDR